MKKIIIFIIIVLATLTANANITNVSISPANPALTDNISILVDGIEGSGGVQITNTDFFINGNSLSLDIYIDLGDVPIITPWSYSKTIGALAAGNYDLTVQRFLPSYYPPPLSDSYSMNFEVVPEPATLFLLGFGIILARKKPSR